MSESMKAIEKSFRVNAFCANSAIFAAVFKAGALAEEDADWVRVISKSDKARLSRGWHTQPTVFDNHSVTPNCYSIHITMLQYESAERGAHRMWASFRIDEVAPPCLSPDLWADYKEQPERQTLLKEMCELAVATHTTCFSPSTRAHL